MKTVPVVVEVTVKLALDVPEDWADDYQGHTEFWLNESSRCAINTLHKLVKRLDDTPGACPCNQTEHRVLRLATPEDCRLYHYEPADMVRS